jgi:hypothetical protein
MEQDTIWDVAVIGGGPAGMMAAGRAAQRDLRVILIEKNESLGKKLLITGGGRCNVTNAEPDIRKFLEKYKDSDKFLFSAFSQHSVKDTLEFFNTRGMDTKVEPGQRVFPSSDSAQSVWNVLVENLKKFNVTILSNSPVVNLIKENEKIVGVKIKGGEIINARNIVIATGGTSRPETGSTGDAYKWLKDVGHYIIEPEPSLVPLALKDKWVSGLSGLSLENIKITTFQNNQKQEVKKGKLLFTHFGISGPTVLNMSKDIGELLKYGEVVISLDLLPNEDYSTLNTKLQELFKLHDKKKLINALSDLIPVALANVVIDIGGFNGETACNSVTKENRIKLMNLLKAVPLHVNKLLDESKAIITSGGVALEEVDFKTMRSRLFPNLYLVGDILNIDRPSGGYSLQLCWTTGFVSGNSLS